MGDTAIFPTAPTPAERSAADRIWQFLGYANLHGGQMGQFQNDWNAIPNIFPNTPLKIQLWYFLNDNTKYQRLWSRLTDAQKQDLFFNVLATYADDINVNRQIQWSNMNGLNFYRLGIVTNLERGELWLSLTVPQRKVLFNGLNNAEKNTLATVIPALNPANRLHFESSVIECLTDTQYNNFFPAPNNQIKFIKRLVPFITLLQAISNQLVPPIGRDRYPPVPGHANYGTWSAAITNYNNQRGNLQPILTAWDAFTDQDKENIWNQLNNREQTIIYDAQLQYQLNQPVSLRGAINYAFDPPQGDIPAITAWAAAKPGAIPGALLTAVEIYQYYIYINQLLLTRRYGFQIPIDDESYTYLHVDVAPGEWGRIGQPCDKKIFGVHAHNICQATTNALAAVLRELILQQKYMQAGEQILNCIKKRMGVLIDFGGGDFEHRKQISVLITLQNILNRAGIHIINFIQVNGSNLRITLDPASILEFREVTFPGGVRTLAGIAGAAGSVSKTGEASFMANPYFPGEYLYRVRNVQGGKRKTRHAKKSKKSKTRKH